MDFEKLHKKAAKRKNSFVEARIGQTLYDICRNPKVKAPIRYLMSGLAAKIEKARKEFKEGKGTSLKTHEDIDKYFESL